MIPTAALIGINFVSGDVVKQIFASDTLIKDPIVACEQSQIRCEKELQEYSWTIISNHEALELHRDLLAQRTQKLGKHKKIILPLPNIPSLKKNKKI